MEYIGIGFELLFVGLAVVVVVVSLVIVVGKMLIHITNRFPEEKKVEVRRNNTVQITDNARAVIESAVNSITSGQGRIVNITKL